MYDIDNLIFPAIIMLLGCIVFVLISLVSIIYNKISYETSLKEWLSDRKYFLLFYLYFYLVMIVMVFLMLFGFFGILAAILILTAIGGIMVSAKNNVVFFTEETTLKTCKCGKKISKVIKIKLSGDEKLFYYICRSCGKKCNKNEFETDGDS